MSKRHRHRKRRKTQKDKPSDQAIVSNERTTTAPLELLARQQDVPQPKTEDHPFLRRLRIVGLPMTAIGIVGFALEIWPHVRVIPPSDLADPLQPYSVSFSIQNSGKLPIYAVEVQCVPHILQTRMRWSADKAAGPQIGNRRFVADEISSEQSRPFVCDVIWMPSNPVLETTYAELGVLVRFRPVRLIPFNWPPNAQVFITSREADGRLRWHEYLPDLQKAPPKYPAR